MNKNIHEIVDYMNNINKCFNLGKLINKIIINILNTIKTKNYSSEIVKLNDDIDNIKNIMCDHIKWKDLIEYVDILIIYLRYLLLENDGIDYINKEFGNIPIDSELLDIDPNIDINAYKSKKLDKVNPNLINIGNIMNLQKINQDVIINKLNNKKTYGDIKDNDNIYKNIIKNIKINTPKDKNCLNKLHFKNFEGKKYYLCYNKIKNISSDDLNIINVKNKLAIYKLLGLKRKVNIIFFYFSIIKNVNFSPPFYYDFQNYPINNYGIFWKKIKDNKYISNLSSIIGDTIEGSRIIMSDVIEKKEKKEEINRILLRNDIYNSDYINSDELSVITSHIKSLFEKKKKNVEYTKIDEILNYIFSNNVNPDIINKIKALIINQGVVNTKNIKYIEKLISLSAWNGHIFDKNLKLYY